MGISEPAKQEAFYKEIELKDIKEHHSAFDDPTSAGGNVF